MLKTLFVWGFVVVPLAIAIVLMVYRARILIAFILVLGLAAAGVWGAMRFGSSIQAWWHGTPSSSQPEHCTGQVPGAPPAEPCGL